MALNYLTRFLTFLDDYFKYLVVLFLIFQAILVFIISYGDLFTYDRGIWFNVIERIRAEARIPYLTTDEFVLGPSEYPVLFTYFLIPFILLPQDFVIYSVVFGLIQVLFSALIFYSLINLFNIKKREHEILLLLLFFCPIYTILALARFDLMPVGLLLFSYYQAKRGNSFLSSVFLAFASTLKLFPLVFIPAFFFIKRLDYKKFLLTFFVTALFLYIPVLVLNKGTIFYPLSFTGSDYRPESLFGFLGFIGLKIPLWIINFYKIGVIVLIVGLTFLRIRNALGFGLSLIILLMVYSPLFSPQWNIWITPLLFLIGLNPLLIIIFDVITFVEFPIIWRIVAGLTSFRSEQFFNGGVYGILFVLLNALRYLFLFYFFYWIQKKSNERFISRVHKFLKK